MGKERERDVEAFIRAVNEFLNDYVEEADTLIGGVHDDFVIVPTQVSNKRKRETDPR
jgi:hypothetical protein